MSKEMLIYAGNILIALASFALVWHHDITWPMAAALVATLLMPSGLHVALSKTGAP